MPQNDEDDPTSAVERRRPDERDTIALARELREHGLAIPVPTAATYDTVTEGRTGWRFVLTPRWLVFAGAAILFVASCVLGVVWQVGQWRQIDGFNSIVRQNFRAPAVPIDDVLPELDSYRASEQWRSVIATGQYLVSQQLYVIDRSCAKIDSGFEVLTPFRLDDGRILVVDRGCVRQQTTNTSLPVTPAAPPSGPVTITAHVVASESNQGPVSGNQVESIDTHQIAGVVGGATYTRAYGLLASEVPAAAKNLSPVISGRPLIDTTTQTVTIFAMVLYVLVGLVIFGYALRHQFRWVNRFSPALWRRELRRIQRAADRDLSDEELEDLQVQRDARAAAGGRPARSSPVPEHPDAAPPAPPEHDETGSAPTDLDPTSSAPTDADPTVIDGGELDWSDPAPHNS